MATIRKRENGRWFAEVRRKGHAPTRKSFGSKTEASRWARAIEKRLDDGGTVTRETLSWLIDAFLEAKGLGTYEQHVLEWWRERLGATRLSELKKRDFALARAALQKLPKARGEGTLAPATINRRMAAISAVLTHAVETLHLLETNPAHIKALSENNRRDPIKAGWVNMQEPLLKACREFESGGVIKQREPALLMLVQLALCTGCRAGELLALRWDDVDLDTGVIYITKNTRRDTTKNTDSRAVPLYGEALEALKTWKQDYRLKFGGYVLGNTRTGTVPYNYRQHWIAVKEKVGIQDLRFHDLRHVAASNMAMAGESLGSVGNVLGHRSAQMTQRYSHYSTASVADLGRRMAERQQRGEGADNGSP